MSWAAQTPACCVNTIAFFWLSKEPRFQIYHTNLFFLPAFWDYLVKYVRAATVIRAVLCGVFSFFLMCDACGEKYFTVKMAGGHLGVVRPVACCSGSPC